MITTSTGGEYEMKAYHHPSCIFMPKTYAANKLSAADFLSDICKDLNQVEILPAQQATLSDTMEQAAPAAKKEEKHPLLVNLSALHKDTTVEPGAKRAKLTNNETHNDDETALLLVQAYGLYKDLNIEQLKDVLRWNHQYLTGTKNYLQLKVIDGHVRGSLARCNLNAWGHCGTWLWDSRVRNP
jgi:hypothetical protein